jgi:hypothetical protein
MFFLKTLHLHQKFRTIPLTEKADTTLFFLYSSGLLVGLAFEYDECFYPLAT